MPLILVAGTEAGAGATTLAVGLAHRIAYAGHEVTLARIAGDGRAEGDAHLFATLDIAAASGEPVAEAALPGLAALAWAGGIVVAEVAAGVDAAALASRLGARLVLVGRAGTPVSVGATFIVNHARTAGPLALAEDRLLAAPSVAQIIEASGATVLARSVAGDSAVLEHIVIGAISHDSDEPYFRRFPRKAVVTRSERVDIVLSALRTETECLVLTGGAEPSPYILDRVAAERSTTLLLAPHGTVETIREIEGTFGRAAFAGEAKVQRIGALIAEVIDDATLAQLIEG